MMGLYEVASDDHVFAWLYNSTMILPARSNKMSHVILNLEHLEHFKAVVTSYLLLRTLHEEIEEGRLQFIP